MFKRFGMFAVTGLLAVMVLAACGSDDDEAEPTVTRVPATNAPVVTATAAEAEEQATQASASPAAASPMAGSPVAEGAASPAAMGDSTPIAASPISSSSGGNTLQSTATANAVPTVEATAAQQAIVVDMKDIVFDPKEITIPANQDVTIELDNLGVTTHNFNIDALNVHSGDYAAGQKGTITINAAPGTYDYYCSIPGHKEAGMVGKLIVQ